ncbi:protein trichome birefringence-like 28 isoform X2 [Malania oleifera]|uniref:protein trichome birefringence-like 28 isoform X2 n=1 Tax=Malania oleifera TaxID=397392 RepID=UPI0025AE1A30|nr:protein trichome birefringence-like 28 isoform X2 [Malania oleifera]
METSSTINERWKLCAIASFMGCLITLAGLKQMQSHDGITLSSFQNLTIFSASSDDQPTPQLKLTENGRPTTQITEEENVTISAEFASKSLNFSENGKPRSQGEEENFSETGETRSQKDEKKQCNIFDGKWVHDPEANPLYHGFQCPFLSDQVSCQRNGRPDSDYEKWGWVARECEIPRFNGTDMLERLRGKRVVLVGDSLNRNQWESLACLLYSAIPPSRAFVDLQSGDYKVFKAKFHWSPFLVQLDDSQAHGNRALRLDKLPASARRWRGASVMVFNSGHWWTHTGKLKAWDFFELRGAVAEMEMESAFETAMNTWSNWINHNVDPNKTTVFFRSFSPEHKGKDWCFRETQPITDESRVPSVPGSVITKIVERAIEATRTRVRYLNVTRLSKYRRDAHPKVYTTKQGKLLIKQQQMQPESYADCSHWCLPGLPDTWNSLLYASLVLEDEQNQSSSSSPLLYFEERNLSRNR